MAYVSKELKAKLAPGIKSVLKKYGMKGTIAVRHHSTLVVNIQSGAIPYDPKNHQINEYWVEKNYTGVAKDFLMELKAAMMIGNFDHSDAMTDYFHVGWYIDINMGQWNKPYICTALEAAVA